MCHPKSFKSVFKYVSIYQLIYVKNVQIWVIFIFSFFSFHLHSHVNLALMNTMVLRYKFFFTVLDT